MSQNTTPQRYRANDRNVEDKQWCYEKYWGEMLSTIEIAALDGCECESYECVRNHLQHHNIPLRKRGSYKDNDTGPFRAFYPEGQGPGNADADSDVTWNDIDSTVRAGD